MIDVAVFTFCPDSRQKLGFVALGHAKKSKLVEAFLSKAFIFPVRTHDLHAWATSCSSSVRQHQVSFFQKDAEPVRHHLRRIV